MNYDEYAAECEEIREENAELLVEFENWLKSDKLSVRIIKNHVSNIDFYINEYLLYDEPARPGEGVEGVDNYLGYWFIKKAMWANKTNIKGSAASLKKFYAFLLQKGLIEKEELNKLEQTIKESMSSWLEALEENDDIDDF